VNSKKLIVIVGLCLLSATRTTWAEVWIGVPGRDACMEIEGASVYAAIDEYRRRGQLLKETMNGGHKIALIGADKAGMRGVVADTQTACVAAMRFTELATAGNAWAAKTNDGNIQQPCRMEPASLSLVALSELKNYSDPAEALNTITLRENEGLVIFAKHNERRVLAVDEASCKSGVRFAIESQLRPGYEKAYTLLNDANSMKSFIQTWKNDDYDNRIPEVTERLKAALRQEYEAGYRNATSLDAMQSFVQKYRDNDPDHYVPVVQAKLALGLSEQQIIDCKRRMSASEKTIETEKEIGRVSGYVNKLVLRRAGEDIVSCRKSIPEDFATYRRLGGKKQLSELR
jgi:hypothetical protein